MGSCRPSIIDPDLKIDCLKEGCSGRVDIQEQRITPRAHGAENAPVDKIEAVKHRPALELARIELFTTTTTDESSIVIDVVPRKDVQIADLLIRMIITQLSCSEGIPIPKIIEKAICIEETFKPENCVEHIRWQPSPR